MTLGLQWIVDKITFPSPPSSYSLTSHPELFFVPHKNKPATHPGVRYQVNVNSPLDRYRACFMRFGKGRRCCWSMRTATAVTLATCGKRCRASQNL